VACGERYLTEAAVSLATLRRSNPGLPALLLTDAPPPHADDWDEVVVDPSLAAQRNRAKLFMDRAPWERSVFLDTDTHIVGDLGPGFDILDRFDFAANQPGGGHHYTLPGLSLSFPEFNSGVIFWRRRASTAALFVHWRELYDQFSATDAGRNWDQKSLRYALWQSDLRIAALPAAFNLMPYFPASVERDLVVAHGRNAENLHRLAARLAGDGRPRAYVPGLGVISHPRELTWATALRFAARLIAWKIRHPFGSD
jgi:hypothetical protein